MGGITNIERIMCAFIYWTKNALMLDETTYSENHDFTNTPKADQLNTVSLKILYYLDYLYLRKKNTSNRMLNDR